MKTPRETQEERNRKTNINSQNHCAQSHAMKEYQCGKFWKTLAIVNKPA